MYARRAGNAAGFLTTYKQEAEQCNLGLTTVMRLAKESGCLVKIGKTPRIKSEEFHQYVFENYATGAK